MASELPPVVAIFDADDEAFDEVVDGIEERLANLDSSNAEPEIGADDGEFDLIYDDVEERLGRLDAEHADPSVGLNDDDLKATLAEDEALLATLGSENDFDAFSESIDGAEVDLERLQRQIEETGSTMNGLHLFDTDPADLANLAALQQTLDELGASGTDAAAGIDAAGASAAAATDDFADLETGSLAAISALDDFQAEAPALAEAGANFSLVFQDLDENVLDLGTSIAELNELGLDTELAFQAVEGAGYDLEGALADAALAIEDLEGGLADLEGALADGEALLQDTAQGLNALEQAGAGFISTVSELASSFGEALPNVSLMEVAVGAIVGALISAIPVIGAFVGELGALSAIGFTGLVGAGAVILGLAGDFGTLENAAKEALSIFDLALEPFEKPIENDAILLIYDAFSKLLPIAEQTAPYIDKILKELGQDMGTPAFEQFIQWIGNNAGPALETVFNFVLDIGKALAEMGENGEPFIKKIESGLDSLGKDLDKFGDSKSFKDFIDWLVTNGPTVGSDLETIGKDLGEIFVALTPAGLTLLDGFTHAMTAMKDAVDPLAKSIAILTSGFDKLPSPVKDALVPITTLSTDIDDMKKAVGEMEGPWAVAWAALPGPVEQAWATIEPIVSAIEHADSEIANSINTISSDAGKLSGGGLLGGLLGGIGFSSIASLVNGPAAGGNVVPNADLPSIGSGALSGGGFAGDGGAAGDSYVHNGDIVVNGSNLSATEIAQEVRTQQLRGSRQYGPTGGIYGAYAGSR